MFHLADIEQYLILGSGSRVSGVYICLVSDGRLQVSRGAYVFQVSAVPLPGYLGVRIPGYLGVGVLGVGFSGYLGLGVSGYLGVGVFGADVSGYLGVGR